MMYLLKVVAVAAFGVPALIALAYLAFLTYVFFMALLLS